MSDVKIFFILYRWSARFFHNFFYTSIVCWARHDLLFTAYQVEKIPGEVTEMPRVLNELKLFSQKRLFVGRSAEIIIGISQFFYKCVILNSTRARLYKFQLWVDLTYIFFWIWSSNIYFLKDDHLFYR